MEHFMDDYFLVANFKKAYTRKVEIAAKVGAPLGRRLVGR
jgi:hypothetical protein